MPSLRKLHSNKFNQEEGIPELSGKNGVTLMRLVLTGSERAIEF